MKQGKPHLRVLLMACGIVLVMGSLAAFSAPLYRTFCEITGFSGVPRTSKAGTSQAIPAISSEASGHRIAVRLNGDVNPGLNWQFAPEEFVVQVRLGEPVLVYFRARNLASSASTGVATFNVTPVKAASFVDKIACFCFTEQTLQPGEVVRMAVNFWIDPALLDERTARDITEITLSYSFFAKTV